MKIILHHCFEEVISIDNLLMAWKEFIYDKKKKPDVQLFAFKLMDNILALHRDLLQNKYQHGGYHSFVIHDPKQRIIHKASISTKILLN